MNGTGLQVKDVRRDNNAERVDKILMDAAENYSHMSNDSCYESDLEDSSFQNRSLEEGANVNGVSDTSPVVSDHEVNGALGAGGDLSETEQNAGSRAAGWQYPAAPCNHVVPPGVRDEQYGWDENGGNEGEPDVYERGEYIRRESQRGEYEQYECQRGGYPPREHGEQRRKSSRHGALRRGAMLRSQSAHGQKRRVAFCLKDSEENEEAGKEQDSGLGNSLERKLHVQHPYYDGDWRCSPTAYHDSMVLSRSSPKPHLDPLAPFDHWHENQFQQQKKVTFDDSELDYVRAGSYPLPVLGLRQNVSREGSPSAVEPPPRVPKRAVKHSHREGSPNLAGVKAADIPREGSPGIASVVKRRTKYFDRYDEEKRKARLYREESQGTPSRRDNVDICEVHDVDSDCCCQRQAPEHAPPLPCRCQSRHQSRSTTARPCDLCSESHTPDVCDLAGAPLQAHALRTDEPSADGYTSSIHLKRQRYPSPDSYFNDIDSPLQRSSPCFEDPAGEARASQKIVGDNSEIENLLGDNFGFDPQIQDESDAALDVQSNREQLLSRSRSCLGCMMLRQYNFGKGTVFGIFAKPANGFISPTNLHDALPSCADASLRPYCDDVMTRSDSDVLKSDRLTRSYHHKHNHPWQHGYHSNCDIAHQDVSNYMVLDKKFIAPARPDIKYGKKVLLRKKPNGNAYESHGLVTIRMKPDPQGRFGFNVKGGSDQGMPIIVSRVAPGTPADLCIPRLNEGDQVLYINGRDVSTHKHEQVVMFIRSSVETHSGELVLVVRPNVYIGDDTADNEPDFQYTPDTYHISSTLPPGGDPLSGSLTLLQEGLESGAALAQFEQLYRKKPGLTMNASKTESNINKNRYRDISPYDQTRVKIRTSSGDYINANFVNMEIPGSGIINRYIAAQGPLPNTALDFWQMVWEQHCTLVVMLTTNVERGRVKCHKYWPDLYESAALGSMQVTCLKEEVTSSFAFREFTLVHSKDSGKERHITQIQYISWPDHGVPEDASDFLHFVLRVRQRRSGMTEPTIVHCSAGIGRTGVLITMETAMCLIEANQPVYPLDIVRQMRDQRAMLIQTSSQYKFVCEAILKVYSDKVVEPLEEFKT